MILQISILLFDMKMPNPYRGRIISIIFLCVLLVTLELVSGFILPYEGKVKEIHIFDAVFNYDVERAKRICRLIIDSGLGLSLAFPHGIRADIMTEELIGLLKKAGTYKLTYGIETAVPRLQAMIKKNLDLEQVQDIVRKTARAGIIVGGYFMLGFPTETWDEMNRTVNFAADSDLDLAAFFKVTFYEDVIKLYQSKSRPADIEAPYDFKDLGYYSSKRPYARPSIPELNSMILKAQQRFYLNSKRMRRSLFKFPRKIVFLRNLLNAFALMLQAYLTRALIYSQSGSHNIKKMVSH